MPIVSFWYSRVFRFVVGKLASVAADAIQRPAHSSIGTGPWQQVQLIDEKFDDDPRPWLQHEQNDLCDGMILLEDEWKRLHRRFIYIFILYIHIYPIIWCYLNYLNIFAWFK